MKSSTLTFEFGNYGSFMRRSEGVSVSRVKTRGEEKRSESQTPKTKIPKESQKKERRFLLGVGREFNLPCSRLPIMPY